MNARERIKSMDSWYDRGLDKADKEALRAIDKLLVDAMEFIRSWENDPITHALIEEARYLGYGDK